MSRCDYCIFYDGEYCSEDNEEVENGGRGCDDYTQEEDCGFDDEDLGVDQDEPWF